MQVLMVPPCYYPVRGGTETVVRNLSMSLNRKGIHTDVMTFNMDQDRNPKWHGKTEIIDGLTVFRIPALNWHPFFNSNKVTSNINFIPGRFQKILRDYDIIHFHEYDFSFPFFSLLLRKPKIIHCHGIDTNFFEKYRSGRMLLKRLADFYVSITFQMTNHLIALGISHDKIIRIPNGINTELFTPRGEKEENLILFVGRISHIKGLDVLIESLRYLRDSVHLVIIGQLGWNQKYSEEILESIKKENQKGKHKINYLGAMDQIEIAKWDQKATMLISPSRYEAFGISLVEALACETPVIGSFVGGIPEIIGENETGFLTPSNNPFALAQAIQHLLDNENIRTKLGREGRKRVVKHYSLEASVEKVCRLYKQISS